MKDRQKTRTGFATYNQKVRGVSRKYRKTLNLNEFKGGAKKFCQPSWLAGAGFHFVILPVFGYSAAFPESWRRNGIAEEGQ
jgi:hypothetical protein